MPINDVYQLTVKGTVWDQDHLHTLHFRDRTGAAASSAIVTVWQATSRTAYRGCFCTADACAVTYTVRQVCGTPPFVATAEATEPLATQFGTLAIPGDRMPSWLARVISWRTAFSGKSYRGRSFLGGLFDDWGNGNNMVAGRLADTNAYITAL